MEGCVVSSENQPAGHSSRFGRREIFIKETIQGIIENT